MNVERLILDYIPLANKLAFLEKRLVPDHIHLDELKSAAYMGLTDAANKFDSSKNVHFGLYAKIRIIGEIRNYLKFILKKANISGSLEDSEAQVKPDRFITEDFFSLVSDKLGDADGKIMHMYYVENRTLGEIGRIRGVSESRISQIISNCHRRLRCVLSCV